MRKVLLNSILILVVFLTLLTGILSAGGEKVDVCHFDADSGTYHMINISDNAFDKHVEHGDAAPGDPVPTMNGYIFNDDCVPVLAIPDCPFSGSVLDDGHPGGDTPLLVNGNQVGSINELMLWEYLRLNLNSDGRGPAAVGDTISFEGWDYVCIIPSGWFS